MYDEYALYEQEEAKRKKTYTPERQVLYLRSILTRISKGYPTPQSLAELALNHEMFDMEEQQNEQ